MDRNHLERCVEINDACQSVEATSTYVSLEAEIPEVLYRGMKEFIGSHPNWDQYRVMSSASPISSFKTAAGIEPLLSGISMIFSATPRPKGL